MKERTGILVINRNCLKFTRDCVADLERQTRSCFLRVVDNGSTEAGTEEFLDSLAGRSNVEVIRTGTNKPICHLWNEMVSETSYPFICLLNNDVKIGSNFVEAHEDIFDREPDVGVVVHPTNHPNWDRVTRELKYVVLENRVRQGWDPVFRREAYVPIPDQIHFFCGDDWLFEKVYSGKYRTAVALSSPMIHFQGRTTSVPRNSGRDIREYERLGYSLGMTHPAGYSLIKPRIRTLREDARGT